MELSSCTKILFFLLSSIFFETFLASLTFNVVELGADPNGIKESTPAFQSAWSSACSSSESVVIFVPKGTFLLHSTQFRGPCKNAAILIQIDGSIVAPTDFKILGDTTSWILLEKVNGVSIQGGDLDGKGKSLWDCKVSDNSNCPMGSSNFGIFDSNNVNITSLTSRDSQFFHIKIQESQNINLERITILAPEESPNTDGIHVHKSSFISIIKSNFSTGDDCISIGPGSSSLWIEDVSCGPGHGISIGSLGAEPEEEGVKNITVTNATFTGTENGVRIKTWAKACNATVEDVTFQHATMSNTHNPIIIDQNYCPGGKDCGTQPSGVKIRNVTYNDIHGSSSTEVAVAFNCSSKEPCSGLMLESIDLNYDGKTADSSCFNAFGESSGTVKPECCLKGEYFHERILSMKI